MGIIGNMQAVQQVILKQFEAELTESMGGDGDDV
jgi:hypothetical protein